MPAVEVTISGILYDKLNRTQQQVVLVGEGSLTGIGVGGGPMPPGPGRPPGSIWPGTPEHPIYWPPSVWPDPRPPGSPPGIWGGANEPFPTPPIYLPPQVPPGLQPPTPPSPGDPTTPVPPPPGQAGWPVQPITPPAYVILHYPGIGPVYVAPPAPAS